MSSLGGQLGYWKWFDGYFCWCLMDLVSVESNFFQFSTLCCFRKWSNLNLNYSTNNESIFLNGNNTSIFGAKVVFWIRIHAQLLKWLRFLRPWNRRRNFAKILQFCVGVLGFRSSWNEEPKAWKFKILRTKIQKSQKAPMQVWLCTRIMQKTKLSSTYSTEFCREKSFQILLHLTFRYHKWSGRSIG